jgi:hypothetical protein
LGAARNRPPHQAGPNQQNARRQNETRAAIAKKREEIDGGDAEQHVGVTAQNDGPSGYQ